MVNESLDPLNVIERCLRDWVLRGGIQEPDVSEVAASIQRNLRFLCDIELKGKSDARS